jgi:hypothetical protein
LRSKCELRCSIQSSTVIHRVIHFKQHTSESTARRLSRVVRSLNVGVCIVKFSALLIRDILLKRMSKPNVLVLGGVGFIGRNFVKWLVDKGVCGKIRVIDKVLPATAFLAKEHQDAFNHPSVEYKQGNLTSVRKFF